VTFPRKASLTVTNACNLRCAMCGQWSDTGYVRQGVHLGGDGATIARPGMTLADWHRVVDELADHRVSWVLVRGGEPFMLAGIVELLEHMRARELTTSIDTNGTLLADFAADLVRIFDRDNLHITVSIDGPEEIHDAVRRVEGCFARIAEGVAALHEAEAAAGRTISLSACFTISGYNYRGLGEMPDVMRRLGIRRISIVPYMYFPQEVGRAYEAELRELGCAAFSWPGFAHEGSGVDPEEFGRQLDRFRSSLGEVEIDPYLELSDAEYRTWFADATTPVGLPGCRMPDELIDIQPDGAANFCVDFPDYSIGNVRQATIEELWNGERAARFRDYLGRHLLAVCERCAAKYMAAPTRFPDAAAS
jgi:MoaA/NifB/PqqE/SkfB family radical SAM enzyme